MGKMTFGLGMAAASALSGTAAGELINDIFPNDRELTEELVKAGECAAQLPEQGEIVIDLASAFGEPCEEKINGFVRENPQAVTEGSINLGNKTGFSSYLREQVYEKEEMKDTFTRTGALVGAVGGGVTFIALRNARRQSNST